MDEEREMLTEAEETMAFAVSMYRSQAVILHNLAQCAGDAASAARWGKEAKAEDGYLRLQVVIKMCESHIGLN